ncbi:hypothetical protein L1987_68509 [Smallanthus sonchifolius]|uniref:Uncharacterized protein n=1 Tax=Smallanthus sonchifolius TaxID=185202 RepID=A0ACB9B3R9_9ASTR|nr:hypothetical protein L1987_68509 [Smallanthus sonchifolius]
MHVEPPQLDPSSPSHAIPLTLPPSVPNHRTTTASASQHHSATFGLQICDCSLIYPIIIRKYTRRRNPRFSAIEIASISYTVEEIGHIVSLSKRAAQRVLLDYISWIHESLSRRHLTF